MVTKEATVMKICLTGGIRSGKSTIAQSLVADHPSTKPLVVVFGRNGCDDEFDARIAYHKSTRPETWNVLELGDAPVGAWVSSLEAAIQEGTDVILLDCVGTLLSCVIDEVAIERYGSSWYERTTISQDVSNEVLERAKQVVDFLVSEDRDCVFVTNEVGMAPISSFASGRIFIDCLGWLNQHIVSLCDKSYLVVAGTTINLTDRAETASWR